MRAPKDLSDKELTTQLDALSKNENRFTCEVILHLGELDSRLSFRSLGYASLFDYCTRQLRYSEGAAMRRIKAARMVREYPQILKLLETRELSLSTLSLISGILTAENVHEVLRSVCGKSKREVEDFISTGFQVRKAEPKEQLRAIALPRKEQRAPVLPFERNAVHTPSATVAGPPVKAQSTQQKSVEAAVPAEERFQLQCVIGKAEKDQLERIKVLLSVKLGCVPTMEQVLAELCGEYLKRHDPKEREERRNNRKNHCAIAGGGKLKSRHVPNATRDRVLVRDEMCCSFVSPEGVICKSTVGLQLDHRHAWGCGGDHAEDNLRVLCAVHNKHEAERVYGREHMRRWVKVSSDAEVRAG